jgi:hypothetical protein
MVERYTPLNTTFASLQHVPQQPDHAFPHAHSVTQRHGWLGREVSFESLLATDGARLSKALARKVRDSVVYDDPSQD